MIYLQLAAHLFLLLFWTRCWVKPEHSFYFNPFLSGTARLVDTVLGFLRPALRLPDRLAAVMVLALLWAFQVMFFARFGKPWQLTLGLVQFTPPTESFAWGLQFAYSGLYTAEFLIQAWTVYFFSRLIAAPNRTTRAQEAFAFFTAPFSRLPLPLQPLLLLALHAALVFAVIGAGALPHFLDIAQDEGKAIPPEIFAGGSGWAQTKILWLALMSFASGLQTLMYTLIFFLFGGLAAVLFGAKTPALICRESADVLLGRFARNPATIGGGFDFTPVLFIIAVSLINGQLQMLLGHLILMNPPS